MLRYFRVRSSALESDKKKTKSNTHNKLNQQRLRVAFKVLDEVRIRFHDTKQFIEDFIDQECLKENISADEVIFLQV